MQEKNTARCWQCWPAWSKFGVCFLALQKVTLGSGRGQLRKPVHPLGGWCLSVAVGTVRRPMLTTQASFGGPTLAFVSRAGGDVIHPLGGWCLSVAAGTFRRPDVGNAGKCHDVRQWQGAALEARPSLRWVVFCLWRWGRFGRLWKFMVKKQWHARFPYFD